MRTRVARYVAIAVCCWSGAQVRAADSTPPDTLGAGVRAALLW